MKTFRDKVVVITGVGSGIGKALAQHLDKLGAQLAITDMNSETLQLTANTLHQSPFTSSFDVSDRETFYAFADQVLSHFGKVDCIINNAGVALGAVSTEDLTYQDFNWVMGINFWGMVYGTKAFLPIIKKQPEGNITNISSLFGITGIGYQTAYCTSKFAIRGFNESLRMEMHVESPHVTISSVHPGGIRTNIARRSKTPEGMEATGQDQHEEFMKEIDKSFITSPQKAASIITSGILKKKERIIVGPDARKADRIVRMFPSRYTDIILKKISIILPK